MLLRNCQKKLQKRIDDYSIANFPHTCLLVGEYGCGKHTCANYIANKLSTPLIDITKDISSDYIDAIITNGTRAVYLIDTDEITEKQQNVLLKFIEEPLENCYIVLISTSTLHLLETVKNRCIIFEFEQYTLQDLSLFIQSGDDIRTIEICHTPGQIKLYRNYDITDIQILCEKMITSMNKASYANTLTISNKLNYDNDYDKYDVFVFMSILVNTITNYIKKENNKLYVNMYMATNDCIKKLQQDKRLNKKNMIENYLTKMWRLAHE